MLFIDSLIFLRYQSEGLVLNQSNNKPGVELAVTIGYFEEEDFEGLKARLEPHFRVGGGIAYEFSEAEVAHIVVTFLMSTLQAVPASLLTSALYDGLKPLIIKAKNSGSKTTLEFKITGEETSQITGGKKYVYARLETNDEEILKEGLNTLKELAKLEYQEKSFELEPQTQQWQKRK